MTAASATVKSKVPADGPAEFVPKEEQIRSRAHEIYRARCDNGDSGDEFADWIAAERELKARDDDGRQSVPQGAAADDASQSWQPTGQPVGSDERSIDPTIRLDAHEEPSR